MGRTDDGGAAAPGPRRLPAAGGLVAAVTVLHFALLRGVFAFEPPQPGAAVTPPSARAMVVRGFEASPMAAGTLAEDTAPATVSEGTDGVGREVQPSPLHAARGADEAGAASAAGAAPADGPSHAGPKPAASPRVGAVPPRLAAPESTVPPVRAAVAAPAVVLPAVAPAVVAAPVVADAAEALPVAATPGVVRIETPVAPAMSAMLLETPSLPATATVASSVPTAAPTSAMPEVPDAAPLPTLERPEPAGRPRTAVPDAPPQATAAADDTVVALDSTPSDAADTRPLLLAQATPAVRTGTGVITDPSNVPVYRTRMPPAVTLNYDLKRGMLSGIGRLEWQPQGQRYTARLEGTVAGIHVMGWESTGTIDADGIAPVRYTDERRGRGTQAANFQRTVGGGGKITYSGPSDEKPLPRGTQDRLTWLIQLAAVAAAEPSRIGPGGRISMFVTGARADADVWSFARTGEETLSIGGRSVPTLKLIREPRYPRDSRVEAWLDPEHHYLPVRARLSNGSGSDAGEALELMLRE